MKIITFFILIFLSIPFNSFAQNFFPMAIGNKYQFEYNYYYNGTPSYRSYPIVFIIEDTYINNRQFFYYDEYWYSYDNQDKKLYIWIQDSIKLAADFNLPADSTQIMYFHGTGEPWKSRGQYIGEIFGEPRTIYKMSYYESGWNPLYIWSKSKSVYFAEDIGLINSTSSEFEDYGHTQISRAHHYQLLFAIIDSISFNPQALDVHILNDLENRPINEFPFVLRAGVSIEYIGLLDTLYADVYVLRQDTILVTHNTYPIGTTTFQTVIDLDSTLLEVDDLIKIRCVASDNTIFENFVTDPDSGFYEFIVLPPSTTGLYHDIENNTFKLNQNYPNPFNSSTLIKYFIADLSRVQISITDILGKVIETNPTKKLTGGEYFFNWDAAGYPSGVYLFNIKVSSLTDNKYYSKTIKMSLLK